MYKHKGCGGERQGNWPESPDSPGRTAWAERSTSIGMRASIMCNCVLRISRESRSLSCGFRCSISEKEAPSVASRLTLRSTPPRAKGDREKSGNGDGEGGDVRNACPLRRVRRYCVAMSCIPQDFHGPWTSSQPQCNPPLASAVPIMRHRCRESRLDSYIRYICAYRYGYPDVISDPSMALATHLRGKYLLLKAVGM